ncbi:hypothetical protein WHR41_04209 [Cladosporium halotolerans]|uniref:Prefoldin subunit 1 n=1 Tax=Cladosporium halotolerans TaxID=1052096 RepID=A0AB34KU19_9PEZI
MAIPNEKLQQLLQEIDAKATFSQQQLVLVRQQLASQARKKRMLELSTAEIDALPKDTKVYNGVGKMFVNTTTQDVKSDQAKDAEAVVKEIDNLKKKENYLEQTLKNSQEHMEALFKRGG